MNLFGSSGIRNIADTNLIQLILKLGLAIGGVHRNVVVGCDTRTSSDALKHTFIAGLLAAGCQASDAGVVPTPTIAFATRDFEAGAMITASHNPPQYNGIKLFNKDGSAFDSHQRKQIEEMISSGSFSAAPWDENKNSHLYTGAIEHHIERILHDFPTGLKARVVVDSNCGAAHHISPSLLTRLGCEVIALNCYPSGFFPRNAEPVEANLRDLMKVTRELGADLGIAHDGDADRMMVVDDKGRFISGDKLMAIFAQGLKAKEVVTTIDASMIIDEMGFKTTRTRVGDSYVSEEIKRNGDFGGEPSGSWIFPGISLCPDGIYAAAYIIAIARQQRLSQLVDNIPSYPILRGSTSSEYVTMSKLQQRLIDMKPLSMNHIDGIKLNFQDSWLLIRKSGTEPRIRITAEAKSEAQVHRLYENGIKAIDDCMERKEA